MPHRRRHKDHSSPNSPTSRAPGSNPAPQPPPPPTPVVEPITTAGPGVAAKAVPRTTGVVFVHGIGTQAIRETLFDWSRPVIDVLTAWRREYDRQHPNAPIGENPVGSADVSDPSNAWIEIDVPAFAGRDREQWLLTEAYWAGDVRAPSFSDAVGYLRRRLFGIVFGIARGYGLRESRRRTRLKRLMRENEENSNPIVQERIAELGRSLDRRWAVVDGLDRIWGFWLVRFGLAGIASVGALLALAIYTPLRAIPIDAVRKKVELAALDTFFIDWFGDLPVLLDDQSQSAAIRTRLLQRVAWLKARGCRDIVLVAHSGGTIVSYATLLRYPQSEFPVTKLITLGEAIKLGWRLEQEAGDWVVGNPMRGDLRVHRPDLRWVDVWASYDPAPSGEMVEVEGCPLVAVESLGNLPDDGRIHVESRPVTNLMNLLEDHGGYWTNDEGFLIPLIRHLDDPAGDGSGARFYRDELDRTVRTERRRRRVSILLAWRWAAFSAAVAALAVTVIRGVNLASVGDSVAGAWSLLPAHQLVSGPIDGIGGAVAVVIGALFGRPDIATSIAAVGPVLLGAAVPIVAVLAIYRRGCASWTTHDAIERAAIRRERFGPPGRPSARSEGILLSGGLAAVVFAGALPSLGALLAVVGVVAVVALIARAS